MPDLIGTCVQHFCKHLLVADLMPVAGFKQVGTEDGTGWGEGVECCKNTCLERSVGKTGSLVTGDHLH